MNSREFTPSQIMDIAIEEARFAFEEDEVPVGAVLLFKDGEILRAHNNKEKENFFHHAEMVVLKKGLQNKGKENLKNSILYVTLEPCLMCLGAMVEARISGLVFGAYEDNFGGVELLQKLWKEGRYPHKFPIYGGFKKEECQQILKRFFSEKRTK